MYKLTVPLAERSYDIHIDRAILSCCGEILSGLKFPRRVAIVTNTTVGPLYVETVSRSLRAAAFEPVLIELPDGEQYKTLAQLETIYDRLIELGFDRGCGLLALGGGVVGDMAGYAAATFLRGIRYAQLPTTVLSQVDSSVGGKTAVNHRLGKNLIGAFYQPECVIIDVDSLATLPLREVAAGLAEVVKYGVIYDAAFFAWLEENAQQLLDGDSQALAYAIRRSCEIKAEIVAQDEREGSVRAWLNYGHTFGHAIEALAGYGQWKHGEAVAVGMLVAARISENEGLCKRVDIERIRALLAALQLPLNPPDYSLDDYVAAMQRDKKVKDGTLTLVLNRGIGQVQLQRVAQLRDLFAAVL